MTIDGKDIFTEYGCTLLKGSYNDLFRYPKRKQVQYNNWAESDGIEPDLSDVIFEPKSVKLNFMIQAASVSEFLARYNKLTDDVSAPGSRQFGFDFGRTYQLRYNSNSAYKYPCAFNEGKNLSVFTLEFIEENPCAGSSTIPFGGISLPFSHSVNGYNFGLFGIISNGGIEDALKYTSVKSPFNNGNTVDLSTIRMQHKEIKLSLWMIARSRTEFFHNHSAFFYQLSRTGTQVLKMKGIGSILVYYTDCPDFKTEIWNDTKIACRFTIALTVPVMKFV